jgi:hypothetical protein
MNFEMQDLVGKWCLVKFRGGDRLCRISEINFAGSKFHYVDAWKPTYPIKVITPVRIGEACKWTKLPLHELYLHDVTVLEPEMADIYIQANNIEIAK